VAACFVSLAEQGVVNFAEARPRDRDWNLRLDWLIWAHRKRTDAEVYKATQRAVCASLIATAICNPKELSATVDSLSRITSNIGYNLQPWVERAAEKLSSVESLAEQYRRVFGDPDDPVYAQYLEELTDWILRMP
jgi:hypothetical protein